MFSGSLIVLVRSFSLNEGRHWKQMLVALPDMQKELFSTLKPNKGNPYMYIDTSPIAGEKGDDIFTMWVTTALRVREFSQIISV